MRVLLALLVVSMGACGGDEADPPSSDAAANADAAPDDVALPDAALTCGDGVLDEGEGCDEADVSDTGRCPRCQKARCGDGFVRAVVEECDDGNLLNGDACSAICQACAGENAYVWPGNNHCYRLVPEEVAWNVARQGCWEALSSLVSYASQGENDMVAAGLALDDDIWLGLNDLDTEGTFLWADGETTAFSNWQSFEPSGFIDEDCVAQDDVFGRWADEECANVLEYVCEDPGWTIHPVTCHAYRFLHRPRTFDAARLDCEAAGAHLATLTDAAEQDFVASRVRGLMWIGLEDIAAEGTFVWVNGEARGFDSWAGTQPDGQEVGIEDCVVTGQRGWYDELCSEDVLHGYVCEVD